MSSSINKGRLCATTLGLLACAAAVAQEAPATDVPVAPATEQAAPAAEAAPAVEAATAEAPVTADNTNADDGIGEVIVTARRVQERLQDVPISITVFNQEQLTDRNVNSGTDLATYTPSLSSNSRYGGENASFAIRGFSQEQRTTPSVGIYFADVVAPRGGSAVPGGEGAGPGSFFDLANVQVLKGPQGTLFGRNTTGGAVLLVPQKPTGAYEGFVENKLGNYDMQQTTAVVNVPFNDSVRFRLGVDRNHRDGYLESKSGIGPTDFADVGYTAARASLVVDVTENVENYTIASWSKSSTNGVIPKVIATITPGPTTNPYFALLANMADAQMQREADGGYYRVGNDEKDAHTETEQYQLINTTTWTASDTLTVKNIASYAALTNDLKENLYGSNFLAPDGSHEFPAGSGTFLNYGTDAVGRPQDAGLSIYGVGSAPAAGGHTVDQSTLTEELQFQGNALDSRLVWQAGGYFEYSEGRHPNGSRSQNTVHCDNPDTLDCYDVIGAHNPRLGLVGNVGYQLGTIDYTDFGLYTQSTYSLTDQLKVTGGVRYTNDKVESDAINARWLFGGPGYDTPQLYCSNPDTGQATSPRGGAPAASLEDCRLQYSKKTDAFTWVLGLDYKPTDDLLLYGKWSRGYRQGGVAPYSASAAISYDAEQVDTYELGSKIVFHGPVRGTFNVAAFYNDFQDQQLSNGFASSTGQLPGNVGIVNAGKSRIYGAEVETVLIPVRGVNLSLSYAYLNAKIEKVDTIPASPPYDITVPLAVEGDPLPYTPKNKLAATLAYTLPFDAKVGDVTAAATYTYQSSFLVNRSSPYGKSLSPRSLTNLNLSWNSIYGGPVDGGLFVTNVFDKEYYSTVTGGLNSFGFESAYLGEPRMYGARVRVNF
ncbi:TonB-dependent receptor [Hydrocarboniphaga sp.]|uniref:TonB-dependent receptor n=1 Tax=Hydrocarboniphaga sp. TaxID=2033016 RepID=UPI003D1417C9